MSLLRTVKQVVPVAAGLIPGYIGVPVNLYVIHMVNTISYSSLE
jgi:hypothetical protein